MVCFVVVFELFVPLVSLCFFGDISARIVCFFGSSLFCVGDLSARLVCPFGSSSVSTRFLLGFYWLYRKGTTFILLIGHT